MHITSKTALLALSASFAVKSLAAPVPGKDGDTKAATPGSRGLIKSKVASLGLPSEFGQAAAGAPGGGGGGGGKPPHRLGGHYVDAPSPTESTGSRSSNWSGSMGPTVEEQRAQQQEFAKEEAEKPVKSNFKEYKNKGGPGYFEKDENGEFTGNTISDLRDLPKYAQQAPHHHQGRYGPVAHHEAHYKFYGPGGDLQRAAWDPAKRRDTDPPPSGDGWGQIFDHPQTGGASPSSSSSSGANSPHHPTAGASDSSASAAGGAMHDPHHASGSGAGPSGSTAGGSSTGTGSGTGKNGKNPDSHHGGTDPKGPHGSGPGGSAGGAAGGSPIGH